MIGVIGKLWGGFIGQTAGKGHWKWNQHTYPCVDEVLKPEVLKRQNLLALLTSLKLVAMHEKHHLW